MDEYKKYLNTWLVGPPSKACQRRIEYSKNAIAKGFRKKLLISDGQVVGQIEYSPAEVSYYPIIGENLIVMNCIWVLKRAKGHDFGKKLLRDMIESEKEASGFATIALENHWSPWFRKEQIEKLGFKPINSIGVTHETKYKDRVFGIYLMWMPNSKVAKPPTWNEQKLLEGTAACTAHPLYHPQTYKPRQILQKHDESLFRLF
jgi:N-acetylglutamate synthase-like GNAT family acetyltransferase